MKYCPYCGADLLDSNVLFCSCCGKKLPPHEAGLTEPLTEDMRPVSQEVKSKTYKNKKKKEKKPAPMSSKVQGSVNAQPPTDDGYDGYYDDVLPPDIDRERDGVDKELVKKIVILGICVVLIISLCVVMMYVL